MSGEWIGVDLDGTLAVAGPPEAWHDHETIGAPVPAMVARVKDWIARGVTVKIFTARLAASEHDGVIAGICRAVEAWCVQHVGQALPIVNAKDYGMIELWDDRAVTVVRDTGLPVVPPSGEGFASHIKGCSACERDHDIFVRPLARPSARFTHFALCPVLGDPLFIGKSPIIQSAILIP